MLWKSIKNNIFLYSLSLSNTINYIFYFPFVILYLFAKDDLSKINYMQIYLFFIIYDLIRNLTANCIRKISKCFGINKIITINLFILALISFLLFFIFIRFSNNKERLNEIIIFQAVIPLINISSLFTSKILLSIYEKKEIIKKSKFLDFYEKFNNLLVFIFILIFAPSLSYFHFYFLCSFIYNLYFAIIFIIFFKCHDEKVIFALFEEKINDKKEVNNIQSLEMSKNIQRKKFTKNIKDKQVLTFEEDTNYSKAVNKFRTGKRKSSANIMNNENIKQVINKNYFSDKSSENNENNENGDIENNVIVLTTNENQTNKNMSNNDNNIQYQKQNIHIINNIQIASSQRVLNGDIKNRKTLIDVKNDYVTVKRKFIFTFLILTPSEFIKYIFSFMLLLKTYSLKNIFPIKIHLLFYCGYFFMGIPFDFLNKMIYAKVIRIKNGKKILLISSFALCFVSINAYIFIFLHPLKRNQNSKLQYLLYILFFILNILIKEGLLVVIRIFYTISFGLGFSKIILRNMKEISITFSCLFFFGYYVSILFIRKGDKLFDVIIYYCVYYLLPIFFLLILFINIINIS